MSVRREIQKSHEALLNTIAQLAAERVDNYFFQLVRSDFITESDQVQTFGRVKSENPDDRRLELFAITQSHLKIIDIEETEIKTIPFLRSETPSSTHVIRAKEPSLYYIMSQGTIWIADFTKSTTESVHFPGISETDAIEYVFTMPKDPSSFIQERIFISKRGVVGLSAKGLLRTSSRQLAKLENDTRDAFWRGSSICIITTQEVVLLQKTDKTAILDTLFTMERVEESYSQEDTIDSYYDPRSEIYLAVYRRRALLLNFKKKSACFYNFEVNIDRTLPIDRVTFEAFNVNSEAAKLYSLDFCEETQTFTITEVFSTRSSLSNWQNAYPYRTPEGQFALLTSTGMYTMEERKTKVATKLALAASRSQTQSLHLINLEFDDSWALNYETFLKQEDAKIIDEFVQRMWTDQLTNPFLSCSNETDVLLMIERYAQIVPEQIGSLAILYLRIYARCRPKQSKAADFLKQTLFDLEQALEICLAKSLNKEAVYLAARIGRIRLAWNMALTHDISSIPTIFKRAVDEGIYEEEFIEQFLSTSSLSNLTRAEYFWKIFPYCSNQLELTERIPSYIYNHSSSQKQMSRLLTTLKIQKRLLDTTRNSIDYEVWKEMTQKVDECIRGQYHRKKPLSNKSSVNLLSFST